MKKALILGTLTPQADAVRCLKELGWWVIVCGRYPGGPGFAVADQFEAVPVNDAGAVEELARRERVDLVCSVGSDKAMPTVACVARNLGLRTLVSVETARLARDKGLLRGFLDAQGISPIRHRRISSASEARGWDRFPAMVKPVDSSGQRGVSRATTLEELERGLERALGFSSSGEAIVEEYIEGPEISANAWVTETSLAFCAISDRLVVEGVPGGIPRGHRLPSRNCSDAAALEVRALVERCIRVLGIENGPVYFQMKLSPEGPKILEIAPRLDGCHLWRLIRMTYGVDLLEASVRLLAGEKPHDLNAGGGGVPKNLTFLRSRPGVVFRRRDHPLPQTVDYVDYDYAEGEVVQPVNGFLERVGYCIGPAANEFGEASR
ncbi:MAG: ATP-grasp domain-containing protein [Deltaproteobacteria bacterium]|nr:ATP-grasp domain-containing protein [Deltaproteobacteria bacterium]